MALKKSYSSRRLVINTIIFVIAFIFIVRLFYLQVIETNYKSSADNNVLRYITEYPARGLIYDAQGRLLIYNEAAYDLIVIPYQISDDFDTLAFCSLTGISREDFIKKMLSAINYSTHIPTIFEEKISKQMYGVLQEKIVSYPGFFIQTRAIRNYPYPHAAQILGYIGEVSPEHLKKDEYYRPGDYIGISGLEKSYEKELRGMKGIKVIMVDVHNRDMGSYLKGKYDIEARQGNNLYTYLDIDLQAYAELLLQNKRGSVVAIDPSTGGILAIASSPTYDPNMLVGKERAENYMKLLSDKNLPLFNRALTGMYPPGSTFKLVVGLVGLETGAITPSSAFPCHGGFPLGGGKMVKCHGHYSPIALTGAIQTSCNAYFCKTFKTTVELKKYGSTEEGFRTWRKYVSSFGLGSKLKVDLPGESSGNIPTPEYYDKFFGKSRWRALSVISVAIGQGEILLTPLQMANVVAIIANRGYYYTPHIARAVGRSDKFVPEYTKKHFTSVDPNYFDYIIEGMYQVVEGGTARNVRMDSIKVCGKTGTVQNAGKNHSVFVAFAPRKNPKIAIAAVVENSGYGATWAAPIVSLMIEKYISGKVKRNDLEHEIMDAKLLNEK